MNRKNVSFFIDRPTDQTSCIIRNGRQHIFLYQQFNVMKYIIFSFILHNYTVCVVQFQIVTFTFEIFLIFSNLQHLR